MSSIQSPAPPIKHFLNNQKKEGKNTMALPLSAFGSCRGVSGSWFNHRSIWQTPLSLLTDINSLGQPFVSGTASLASILSRSTTCILPLWLCLVNWSSLVYFFHWSFSLEAWHQARTLETQGKDTSVVAIISGVRGSDKKKMLTYKVEGGKVMSYKPQISWNVDACTCMTKQKF